LRRCQLQHGKSLWPGNSRTAIVPHLLAWVPPCFLDCLKGTGVGVEMSQKEVAVVPFEACKSPATSRMQKHFDEVEAVSAEAKPISREMRVDIMMSYC
jgi:hypothetical protein